MFCMYNAELHLVYCQLTFCGLGVGICLGASPDIALTGPNTCFRCCGAEKQPGRVILSEKDDEERSLKAPALVQHSHASSAAVE